MSHDHLDNWINNIDWFHGDEYLRVVEGIEQDEDAGKMILPPPENILNPFTWFAPEDTRVVLLNDEPYTDPAYATGLPLSVSPECTEYPEVLQNVLGELNLDTGVFPEHGCLNDWAKQGVLMLNLSMSVREGESGSHWSLGWSGLIDDVVKWVSANTEDTVFLFWGKPAQGKRIHVHRSHKVINTNSPRSEVANKGFFGSRPFTRTNQFFADRERPLIDWSLD